MCIQGVYGDKIIFYRKLCPFWATRSVDLVSWRSRKRDDGSQQTEEKGNCSHARNRLEAATVLCGCSNLCIL